MREKMEQGRKAANSPQAKAEWKRKIAAIDEILYGPPVAEDANFLKPAPKRSAAGMSPEEWKASHLALLKSKLAYMPERITKENLETLIENGVAVPASVKARFLQGKASVQ